MVCAYFALTAPHPAPGTDLASLLNSNPDFYNLSLGHLFDLTGDAMGLFRGPLTAVALSMLGVGLVSYLLRRRSFTYAANLVLATAMTVSLLAAHEGLVRFYPVLGSKNLALTVKQQLHPGDRVIIDGWLSSGSSLLFYTGQQAGLVNGRIYGPWYGSFWPDAPPSSAPTTVSARPGQAPSASSSSPSANNAPPTSHASPPFISSRQRAVNLSSPTDNCSSNKTP
ncbi:hypothetical protein RBB78_12305 [Tunturiibacter empetritectus]|uniref:hypothetical protein n=1 Tax=Tunturiibacter empetritectus TaxID=3069691 RepID=UPI003D9B80E8